VNSTKQQRKRIIVDIQIAQKFIMSLQEGDAQTTTSLLHKNATWHQPGQTPLSGIHSGRDAVLNLLAGFASRGIGIEFLEAYRCDNEILCQFSIKHSIGERREFQLIHLKDGQIDLIRHFGDTDYLSAIFRATDAK
jgi:ketosteroid isomerase-like protein